jgi:hypothetical protein
MVEGSRRPTIGVSGRRKSRQRQTNHARLHQSARPSPESHAPRLSLSLAAFRYLQANRRDLAGCFRTRRRSWGSALPFAGLLPLTVDAFAFAIIQPACRSPDLSSPTVFVGFFSRGGVLVLVCQTRRRGCASSTSGLRSVRDPPRAVSGTRRSCLRFLPLSGLRTHQDVIRIDVVSTPRRSSAPGRAPARPIRSWVFGALPARP